MMADILSSGAEGGLSLAVLDDLVLSYLGSERLIEPSSEDPAREACQACHDHLAAGRVEKALQLAEQIHPDIFQDQRLLFRMKKQQFTELLRVKDFQAATGLLRRELAPLALDAYPEAYGEFKRAMLQFVYVPPEHHDGNGPLKPTPVGDDTSFEAREHAAKVLCGTLRQAIGIHDPPLVLLLHYLHQCWRASSKINLDPPNSPSDDIRRLFNVADRDPPAMSQEEGYRPFPESEVQALAHAVDVPRQTAEQALRQTDGDAVAALKNELSRLRHDTHELDKLVHEYASYRGLIRPSCDEDGDNVRSSVVPMDICEGDVASSGEIELRWVGRQPVSSKDEAAASSDGEKIFEESSRKFAVTVHLRGLANKGLVDDVVDGIQSLDEKFFENNPQLLFELKRCKFLRLVEDGDMPSALALARGDLGPLAERCPGLLASLKRTLATLLEREPDTRPPNSVIASVLQDALRESLGLAEPKLVKILRYLLDVHTNWFRKEQRCKDHFEGPLGIADLKAAAPLPSEAHARGLGSTAAMEVSAEDKEAESASDEDEEDGRPSEEAILTLMEFMALSRPLAIDYLMQYDGSAETVIAHLLG